VGTARESDIRALTTSYQEVASDLSVFSQAIVPIQNGSTPAHFA
jgi:hypothetical protein